MRYCLTEGCGELVEARVTYCPTHEPPKPAWAGSSSEAKGWAWTRTRRRILARDRFRCLICGSRAVTVDAIKPSSQGGSHSDPRNLRSLCQPCHDAKTEQDRRAGYRSA